jgi:hypothetical protein
LILLKDIELQNLKEVMDPGGSYLVHFQLVKLDKEHLEDKSVKQIGL